MIPPIGAQGLNLGLRDAAALAECVADARAEGRGHRRAEDARGLSCSARAPTCSARTVSVDLLNRSLLMDFLPVQALRGIGLHLLANVPPLRRLAMRGRPGARRPPAPPDAAGCASPEPLTRRPATGQVPCFPITRRRPQPCEMPSLKDLRYRVEYCGLAADRGARARGADRRRRQRLGQGLAADRPASTAATSARWTISRSPSPTRACRSAQADRARHVGEPRPGHGRDHADRPHHGRPRAHRDRQPEHSQPLPGQARLRRRRVPAHGQLGAGHLAHDARRQQPRRRLSHGQEPLRRPLSARGAATLYPGGLLGKGRDREEGQTHGAAASWISCARAAASGSSATCTTARGCRCRSSAGRPRPSPSPP